MAAAAANVVVVVSSFWLGSPLIVVKFYAAIFFRFACCTYLYLFLSLFRSLFLPLSLPLSLLCSFAVCLLRLVVVIALSAPLHLIPFSLSLMMLNFLHH